MTKIQMVRIRMRKPHGSYRVGEIIQLPERDAESLIAWEYAERANDSQTLIETATDEPKVETADVTPRRRRK